MSSPSQQGLESPITVKVLHDGTTRRLKMPLRDMVPRVLDEKIRNSLSIPLHVESTIERYSDSAGTYVKLDTNNVSVYKQLYRAAKAKSKLKLKVTTETGSMRVVPKPVTVEDESDTIAPSEATASLDASGSTVSASSTNKVAPSPATVSTSRLPIRIPEAATETLNSSTAVKAASDARKDFEAHISRLMEGNSATASRLPTTLQPIPAIPAIPATQSKVAPKIRLPCAQPRSCPAFNPVTGVNFAVSCNGCEKIIPNVHYHCSTCDDGDFDLCETCVTAGTTCHAEEHWLIKRFIRDGQMVNSLTQTIPSRPKVNQESNEEKRRTLLLTTPALQSPMSLSPAPIANTPLQLNNAPRRIVNRTCNSCVDELPESAFVHCKACPDYDLCQPCFASGRHGHHPKHEFVAAVPGTRMNDSIRVKMAAGRNQMHHAICDGCDKYITGVRHKCLDCPDWDYCGSCVANADFIHQGHRFVPIYESLTEVRTSSNAQAVHIGICCDGPLCSKGVGYPAYIRGIRYKCAVCHDLDLCANCEASPANGHNKTHPLIKFKTPVRNVNVKTTGEHEDGRPMRLMGDRQKTAAAQATTTQAGRSMKVSVTEKVEPKAKAVAVTSPVTKAVPAIIPVSDSNDLSALFVKDSVADGTILGSNHVFEQTWILKNDGNVTWPAGCSVKFVGGDYMGHVDSSRPAGMSELVSASETTICYAPLAPGQEFAFTALLRTPPRSGRVQSYWRLTTPEGHKFGQRMWCDVIVRGSVKPTVEVKVTSPKTAAVATPVIAEKVQPQPTQNQMVFPKLENESPLSSIHEDTRSVEKSEVEEEKYDDCAEDEEWDASDSGFMTDEEYDILDASDEELLDQ